MKKPSKPGQKTSPRVPSPKNHPPSPPALQSLRVALFADAYLPLIEGSVTFLTNFIKHLTDQGHHPTLVVPFHPEYRGTDPRILSIPSMPAIYAPPGYRFPLATHGHIDRLLASQEFDLVHVHSPFATGHLGVQFAKRRRIPALMMYHTLYPEYAYHYGPRGLKRFSRRLITYLNTRVCNQCDAITIPSTPMAEVLASYGIRTPLHLLPGGIRTEVYAQAASTGRIRDRLGIPKGVPVLLFVGRLGHEKSVDFLLHVLARIRTHQPAHLILCGDGAARPSLEALTRQLGLTPYVHFAGFIADEHELVDYYADADAFVFGSQTDTQGIVLLEAMAAGLPVVAVNVLGPASAVSHGVNGLLSPPVIEEFADHVLRVLTDRALRTRLQAGGRQLAHDHSFSAVTERMVGLYRRLLNQTPS